MRWIGAGIALIAVLPCSESLAQLSVEAPFSRLPPVVATEPTARNPTAEFVRTPAALDEAETPATGTDSASDGENVEEMSTPRPNSRFDQAVVQRGRNAFETSCTTCHDADRSLEKRKSLSGWIATVRRMARMDGAEVSPGDIEPIATYLASLNPDASPTGSGDGSQRGEGSAADELASTTSFSATISTLWLGGNDNFENPGFFPDAWATADFQPNGPVRGKITACTSCHSDQTFGGGFTLELVEAAAHLDLLHWRNKHHKLEQPRLEAGLKAGRILVPFGAFAANSHPGVYRTVTNPLMYIMGRNVNPNFLRPPVLPMPYSDEGINLDATVRLPCDWSATLDVYAVNGLQGFGDGIQFTPSRSYTDNNHEPATGGRATIGNRSIRIGGSVMTGRMQDEGLDPLLYRFAGGDATVRIDDWLRFYFEYAIRDTESEFERGQIAYGSVYECELLLLSDPNISILGRYDTETFHDGDGDESIHRFTWGINTVLSGGSLLILNHEIWNFDDPEPNVDVFGVRWVATF